MRVRRAAMILILGIASMRAPAMLDAAASADQPHQLSPAPVTALLPRAATRPNPFAGLFTVPPVEPAASSPGDTPLEPKVVCGTTLIPADPQVDPRFAAPRPQDAPRYTIRAIEPPLCR